jgi:hypothetical protein
MSIPNFLGLFGVQSSLIRQKRTSFIDFSAQTMFQGFKHCLSGWNNVWGLQTMFGPKKQCLTASNIVFSVGTLFQRFFR